MTTIKQTVSTLTEAEMNQCRAAIAALKDIIKSDIEWWKVYDSGKNNGLLSYELFHKIANTNVPIEAIELELENEEDTLFRQVLRVYYMMRMKYNSGNAAVEGTYLGEYKRANCSDGPYRDPEFAFANIFFGAQVYREKGKFVLKVSFDAEPERYSSSQEVEERLCETYNFIKVKKDGELDDDDYDMGIFSVPFGEKYVKPDPRKRFDNSSTYNIVGSTYEPTINAEFIYSEDGMRILRNTFSCAVPTTDNEVSFPTIQKAHEVMFKGDSEHIKKYEAILAKHLQTKKHPEFFVVFVTDSALGEGVLQYDNAVLRPLYLEQNCKYINDFMGEKSFDMDSSTLTFINGIPTALTETIKRSNKEKLMQLEMALNDTNLCIIKTADVASLDLYKNPKNYCIFDTEADFSASNYLGCNNSLKMMKALEKEVPHYLKYLMSLDLPESIEVNENSFTEQLRTQANRVKQHADAWLKRDINFFKPLDLASEDAQRALLLDIKKAMNDKRPHVSQFTMVDAFLAMEVSSMSRTDIIGSFRAEYPNFFSTDKSNNTKQQNSDERFWLNSPHNPFYEGSEYDKAIKIN